MPDAEPSTARSPYERGLRIVLVAALAASGILAIVAGHRMLSAAPVWNDQPLQWARVAGIAAVAFAGIVVAFPRHASAAATVAAAAAAAALIGVGPVACVALLLLAWYGIGAATLGRTDADVRWPHAVVTLAGASIAIGAFAATARLRVHYPAVHAAIALATLLLAHRPLAALFAGLIERIRTPRNVTATERGWIVLAGVVAVIHVVVAAKPEVGYDASTMHLQFAELVRAGHAFRHGVDRYVWAAMPLGADYAFASAYLLGGEAAARALNLAFGALACTLVYRIAAAAATREFALAATTLFASMPLAVLVTASLFSETLWIALLLATLFVALHAARDGAWLPALALIAGGAMATKVISLLWLAPLAVVVACAARHERLPHSGARARMLLVLGAAIGALPYVASWVRTGNPVFPFMNGVFRSPLFDASASFNNPHYNAPLLPWTPWDVVLHSARFIEGRDGALGLAWLVAFAFVAVHFLRRRPWTQRATAVVVAVFFVLVYLQQSYLRYLLPAFAALAALGAIAMSDAFRSRAARIALFAAGVAAVAFDVRNVAAGHYPNATPCTACLSDPAARERYVETYAPLRSVSARLNRELPDARVGFMLPNEAAPAGFVGMSRSGNWHDDAFFRGLVRATDAEALAALSRKYELTHVVVRATPDAAVPAIAAFAARYTTPLWRIGDYVVASVRSDAAR